jgi:hypothetical protein
MRGGGLLSVLSPRGFSLRRGECRSQPRGALFRVADAAEFRALGFQTDLQESRHLRCRLPGLADPLQPEQIHH